MIYHQLDQMYAATHTNSDTTQASMKKENALDHDLKDQDGLMHAKEHEASISSHPIANQEKPSA